LKTPRGARTLENILNVKWGGPPGPRTDAHVGLLVKFV
jgi:hypothetical protein